ncbi:MAG: FAD-dependent oxidoreductase [Candidatus Odinarchaeota archaeon]
MSERVLVIGGGIAGIKASLDLGRYGIATTLVERSEQLGGNYAQLGKTFPDGVDAEAFLEERIKELKSLRNVKIYTGTRIKSFKKQENAFEVILDPDGTIIDAGAVIVATGFKKFDAKRIPNYGHGKYENVLTAAELIQILKDGGLGRPSDGKLPKSITFIQCVGSRDKKTNEYCSSFCCTYAMHLAKTIKQQHANVDVTILYMDMRTFSSYESLFREGRELGIKLLRSRPSLVIEDPVTKELMLHVENTLTQELLYLQTDMVVLAIGAEPSEGSDDLGMALGLVSDERTGFFVTNSDDVTADGQGRIFIAGNANGPKDTQYSLAQASAAAMKAIITIKKK